MLDSLNPTPHIDWQHRPFRPEASGSVMLGMQAMRAFLVTPEVPLVV
jgi:hypothetical protein